MSELQFEVFHSSPDLLALTSRLPEQFPFLLESTAVGSLGRYSLLLQHNGESLVRDCSGRVSGPGSGTGFLPRFEQWYRQLAISSDQPGADFLPFVGGWFVYLAYEMAAEIEPILDLPKAPEALPVALAARCDAAIVIAHDQSEKTILVAESDEAMNRLHEGLASAVGTLASRIPGLAVFGAEPKQHFTDAVEKIQGYLLAGDVFQVNLSRAWSGLFEEAVQPTDLYARLRTANPAPFSGLMQWQQQALLSSSPERLVETEGRQVQTRPIAGTHPRGLTSQQDHQLREAMLAHPKERAEHIMLIDLERNDLGRVCVPGSVEVNELMVVESYAHVHHIVSNVRGVLRQEVSPIEVLAAVFPGGTITGCPKVRCMEIIAELEGAGRGFYTGSMGYVDRRGRMDMNILIRSMLLDGRKLAFRTGAGIVADSDPEQELQETEHKALGMLAALDIELEKAHGCT